MFNTESHTAEENRNLFINTLNMGVSDKKNNFAKTFIAKCDARNLWKDVTFVTEGSFVVGAGCYTISKRLPKIANLQLLFTFAEHRGKGAGKYLFNWLLFLCMNAADYFRVSSEKSAVEFYKKEGLKFWGQQKSDTYLCFAKVNRDHVIPSLEYVKDEVTLKNINKETRGGVYFLSDI